MEAQIIEKQDKKKYAVIPYKDFFKHAARFRGLLLFIGIEAGKS